MILFDAIKRELLLRYPDNIRDGDCLTIVSKFAENWDQRLGVVFSHKMRDGSQMLSIHDNQELFDLQYHDPELICKCCKLIDAIVAPLNTASSKTEAINRIYRAALWFRDR